MKFLDVSKNNTISEPAGTPPNGSLKIFKIKKYSKIVTLNGKYLKNLIEDTVKYSSYFSSEFCV